MAIFTQTLATMKAMQLILCTFFSVFLIISCSPRKDAPPRSSENIKKSSNLSADDYGVLKCYSKLNYEQDLDQLSDSIIKIHPKPFDFISQENFSEFVNTQKAKISNTTTVGEFYGICKSIVAKVGCAHTNINKPEYFNYPENLYFPVTLFFLDSSLLVIDSQNSKLSIGTEIISINGNKSSKILKDFSAFVSSDGYNSNAITSKLNSNFSFYFLLAYGFQSEFEVIARNDNNQNFHLVIQGGKMRSIDNYFKPYSYEPLHLEFIEESNTAILTIKTFGYYKAEFETYKFFLDESFKKLKVKGTENLIIDLRGNGGGDPYCGSYLLEFIAREAFVYFDTPENNNYKTISTSIQPKTDRYIGQIYVLTDGKCLSTTGHVCSLIKYHHMAELVGEETGATVSCNDYSR
jgi:hypothetical protein